MQRQQDSPTRRELLGLVGGAGFVGLAGCSALGGSDDEEPENPAHFDVSIIETNEPVSDGEVLEVTVMVENTGEGEGTQEVLLDVGGVSDSTRLTLGAGESEEVTLAGRLSAEEGKQKYDATVKSNDVTDLQRITVSQPANFELELVEYTEELIDGETFEISAQVTNSGGVEATTPITLSVTGADEDPASTQVTLAGGKSTTVTLEWETEDATWANEVTLSTTDDSFSRSITVVEPASLSFKIQNENAPVLEGQEYTVELVVMNSGGASGEVDVSMSTSETQLDSVSSLTVPGGEEEKVFLSWTPQTSHIGEHTIFIEVGEMEETLTLNVNKAIELGEHNVIETDEHFAELMEITVKNNGSSEQKVGLTGEIDLASSAISGYEGVYTNDRNVIVPGESTETYTLKIPTGEALSFNYTINGDPVSFSYTTDASLTRNPEGDTSWPDHEKLFIKNTEFTLETTSQSAIWTGAVDNISEELAEGSVIGVFSAELDSGEVRTLTGSVDVSLFENEQVEFELDVSTAELPASFLYLEYLEIDGVRKEPGTTPSWYEDL